MLIQILLIFLGPSHSLVTVVAEQGITSEFANDEGLVLGDLPGQIICLLRQPVVPADIFAQGVIDNLRLWIRVVALVGGSQQTGWIQLARLIDQAFEKLETRFTE